MFFEECSSLAGGLFGYIEMIHGVVLLNYEAIAIMKNSDYALFG